MPCASSASSPRDGSRRRPGASTPRPTASAPRSALWRGEALAGAAVDGEAGARATRLQELREAAAEDRIDVDLARGRHDVLVAEAEAMVVAAPLRERRWGQLMVALYRSGRQADALRAYQSARRTLADQLGVEPGPELRRLEAAVLAHDEALAVPPPVPAAPAPATATPAPAPAAAPTERRLRRPLTACLGRDAERARLERLLDDGQRLVTLVGPGGAGKSRLALEVAHALDSRLPDGAWWVELAPVSVGAVMGALARTLGLDVTGAVEPEEGAARLGSVLAHRRAVVVLDNCEHVIDEAAVLVDGLLARAPDLRVLATSREGLAVPGEVLFPLPPLPLSVAVDLFAERASAGGVALAPGEVRADGLVGRICARLDGLPLAVELAAARARHLGLAQLAERLGAPFEVLTGGPRTAEARQRTLRAVVDWSYELLDEPERRVFERLGAFASGASLAGAAAVCAGDGVPPTEVETLLGRLVDKSLVVAEHGPTGVRHRMLQTLVEYALERLRERGEEAAIRRRHAEWVADLATTVELHVDTVDRNAQMALVQAEAAEIDQAIGWALVEDPPLALLVAGRLGFFWTATFQTRTGWAASPPRWRRPPTPPRTCGRRPSPSPGWRADWPAPRTPPRAYVAEAVALDRASGDPQRIGRSAFALGGRLALRGDGTAARPWLDESRQAFAAAGDERGLAYASCAQGFTAAVLDDPDSARWRTWPRQSRRSDASATRSAWSPC